MSFEINVTVKTPKRYSSRAQKRECGKAGGTDLDAIAKLTALWFMSSASISFFCNSHERAWHTSSRLKRGRLCDEAKPTQILISPRVLVNVEHAVKVELVGEFELKGIRRPLAYNVISANVLS